MASFGPLAPDGDGTIVGILQGTGSPWYSRIDDDPASGQPDADNMGGPDWADGGRLDLILDAAGGAGDPWITALPGAYGAGTAGNRATEATGGIMPTYHEAITEWEKLKGMGEDLTMAVNPADYDSIGQVRREQGRRGICSACGDARFIRFNWPMGHPYFGRSVKCPECNR